MTAPLLQLRTRGARVRRHPSRLAALAPQDDESSGRASAYGARSSLHLPDVVPSFLSSSSMPMAVSSSRMRSASLKFLAFRAALRASINSVMRPTSAMTSLLVRSIQEKNLSDLKPRKRDCCASCNRGWPTVARIELVIELRESQQSPSAYSDHHEAHRGHRSDGNPSVFGAACSKRNPSSVCKGKLSNPSAVQSIG